MRDNKIYTLSPDKYKRVRGRKINAFDRKNTNSFGPDKSKISRMISESLGAIKNIVLQNNRVYLEDFERVKLIFHSMGFKYPHMDTDID